MDRGEGAAKVGEIGCELPNNNLNKFEGNIALRASEMKKIPLNVSNVVLRGCSLKNTEWARGVVVFTGHDTKLMMNSA